MNFSEIAYCKIYPGIGIARLGNSPCEYFVGPESPYETFKPEDGFKDDAGRVKRQAARFRVYAFNAADEAIGELTAETAELTWTVELANKKASFSRFAGKYNGPTKGLRNPDVAPAHRRELDVTPGPLSITGKNQASEAFSGFFKYQDTKQQQGWSEVTLGELRTDGLGRLLVLGGVGKAGSVIADNPIGNPKTGSPGQLNDYANNVAWHDDTSDGPVRVTVTMNGRTLTVHGQAHVIVAPPDFAPNVLNIVTLYDVAKEAWSSAHPDASLRGVEFYRDILPILERVCALRWTNATALRGHGPGRVGDLVNPELVKKLASPDEQNAPLRQAVFQRLRDAAVVPFAPNNPHVDPAKEPLYVEIDTPEAKRQANARLMPIMAGDGGDPEDGNPATWMTLLPSQYEAFKAWAAGSFVTGVREPSHERSLVALPVSEQPAALDRAALEHCVGAPFYPGIEMTYIAAIAGTWGEPLRLAGHFGPGDVTKYMAVPWQADFYECRAHWWPATRPDDVIPEAEFRELAERLGPHAKAGSVAKLLDGRVSWDRGLSSNDDADEFAGDNDMVRLWHQLGFVVPKTAANGDVVQVETERQPYVGENVPANHRQWFYYLMNADQHQAFLPKAKEIAYDFLAKAAALQNDPDFLLENPLYSYFPYSREALDSRLEAIYNSLVAQGEAYDPATDENFRTKEDVLIRIYQLAPFNQLDGAWLRYATRTGPIDQAHSNLFSVWMDEVGDGDVEKNHCNVYTTLLRQQGIFLPPVTSRAYAENPKMLDSAYTVGVFELAISEFSEEFYPEILGMTLQLEWEVPGLIPTRKLLERFGIDTHFYELHIGIDNAASGHGAKAYEAVRLYLDEVLAKEGEAAVQEAWRRIWTGYVAFEFTGTVGHDLVELIKKRRQESNAKQLESRVIDIINEKRHYANRNHGGKTLGDSPLNELFDDPHTLLDRLQSSGFIIAGQPELSPFFQLTSFDGPMFKVFSDDELETWRAWTRSLSECPKPPPDTDPGAMMARVLKVFKNRQVGVRGHAVLMIGPGKDGAEVTRSLSDWFADSSVETLMGVLANPRNGWVVPFAPNESPLVTSLLSGGGRMSVALQALTPDGQDLSYADVVTKWIEKGCPLPHQAAAAAHSSLKLFSVAQAKLAGATSATKRFWGKKDFLH